MSIAQKLISGGTSEKALYEQAMQFIADDIGFKMGEMEEFMSLSEDFMSGVDLQQGIFDEKGMALLEKWESGDSLLLGDDKEKILSNANSTMDYSENVIEVAKATDNQYSNLFK